MLPFSPTHNFTHSLCLYLSVYLSIYLSIFLPIYLSVCPSIYLSIYLSISFTFHFTLVLVIDLSYTPIVSIMILPITDFWRPCLTLTYLPILIILFVTMPRVCAWYDVFPIRSAMAATRDGNPALWCKRSCWQSRCYGELLYKLIGGEAKGLNYHWFIHTVRSFCLEAYELSHRYNSTGAVCLTY